MALVDYRLLVYVRLWDLLLASPTVEEEFYEQNRIRIDAGDGTMEYVKHFDDPSAFPKIALYMGSGTDSGHPAKYGAGYDGGAMVGVTQEYTVKLTFERSDDLLTASPLIAEVRAAILRGGARLGGEGAGFGYVRLSSPSQNTITVGPDDETGEADRLVATFTFAVAMNLSMAQLTGNA